MRSHADKPLKRRAGFTAIELAAVASIIAILALILIPIVRNRLEVARETAAIDDMRTIEVAQMMASADTAFYFRLNDLDNPALDNDTWNNGAATAAELDIAAAPVPNGTWNRNFSISEQTTGSPKNIGAIGSLWNGPYTTFNKGKFVKLVPALADGTSTDLRWRRVDITAFPGVTDNTGNQGPIPIHMDGSDPLNDDDARNEDYPRDPWRGAHLFFGPGRFGNLLGDTANTGSVTETNFGTAVVYSTGPNLLPGSPTGPVAATDYFREAGVLGTGDDFYRIF